MYSRVSSILIDRTANGVKTEEPHLVTDRIAFRQGRRFSQASGRYHIFLNHSRENISTFCALVNTHYYIDGSTFLHVLPSKSKQVVFIIRLIRTTKVLQRNQVVLFGPHQQKWRVPCCTDMFSSASAHCKCPNSNSNCEESTIENSFHGAFCLLHVLTITLPRHELSWPMRLPKVVRLAPLGDTHIAPRHNPPLDPLDAFLKNSDTSTDRL